MARKENARGQPTIWPEYSDESWGGHLRHRHGLDLARDQIAATVGTSAGITIPPPWSVAMGSVSPQISDRGSMGAVDRLRATSP